MERSNDHIDILDLVGKKFHSICHEDTPKGNFKEINIVNEIDKKGNLSASFQYRDSFGKNFQSVTLDICVKEYNQCTL